jgi:glycosyltransferase involved in cell wall biosynthesis
MTFKVANIVSAYNSKSGGPPRVISLMAAAGAGYWRSELFTTDYRESSRDELLVKEFPGPVNVLPSRCQTLLGGVSMMFGLRRRLLAPPEGGAAPDLVHIHGMWQPYLAAYAAEAARLGVPYIVAPHGMLEPWSLSARSVRKMLALKSYQGRLMNRASALHATSELEADNLRRLTRHRTPVFVVPNAVAAPAPRAAPRTAMPGEPRVLLFLSRLHEKKGLGMLLEAWNEVRPAGWQLLIVGSGAADYAARLERYCAANQVPDVEFKAHVEAAEREAVFARAAAFVLPTYSENFGSVVAEALIRGIPVLTTTGTPWSDIVTHGCGWYVEPTPDAVRRGLIEVAATDSATLEGMGERGRSYAEANFSVAAVRGGLLDMYRAALEAGGRRGRVERVS